MTGLPGWLFSFFLVFFRFSAIYGFVWFVSVFFCFFLFCFSVLCNAQLLFETNSCIWLDNVVPNKLIQVILDSEELEPYWHPDMKDRVPLNILQKYVGSTKGISKFGKDVLLIKSPNGTSYFEINSSSLENGLWHVEISYKVEGVVASFVAKQMQNRTWQLLSATVVEK